MPTLEVSRFMRAPRRVVHSVLSDIDAHQRLADDEIQLVDTDHKGARPRGLIRLNPPLPLTRTVLTDMTSRDEPDRVVGTASIGSRKAADIEWRLEQRPGGTLVRLTAKTRNLSNAERLLLNCGGMWWLRRRFAATLRRLERLVQESGDADRCGTPRDDH